MQVAQNYTEWKAQAQKLDAAANAEQWKLKDETPLYDYRVIRRRFEELKQVRAGGDAEQLFYYLNEGLHGNMGGMGAKGLYRRARLGTKQLIHDYVAEVVAALQDLDKAPQRALPKAERLAYFRRAFKGFGRSALMLGGAGSMGAFHLGVVRAMLEADVLPRVISGASAGAFITALIGTHEKPDLATLVRSDKLTRAMSFDNVGRNRRQLDQYDLKVLLSKLVPDLTFHEAYELTGMHINISVAAGEPQQRSRLLNATTSPNACIHEAVLASCAMPGLYPAVTLMAKDRKGKRVPYVPSRVWIDGSITDDQPSRRLARLYSANHFISSQVNPFVQWNPLNQFSEDNLLGTWLGIYDAAARKWLQALYPLAMQAVREVHPLNIVTRTWFGVATQEYTADINIVPRRRSLKPDLFYETLSRKDIESLVTEGEISTWPRLEQIRLTTAVSRCLDGILLGHGEDVL